MSASVDVQDAVAVVTIDDGRANALSPELIGSIDAALAEAEQHPDVGAIVLIGRPGRFSAGFDLSVMQSGDQDAVVDMVAGGGRLVRRLYGGPKPVVAACTGHAVAAGALLLLGCDRRIGPDADVKIGLNEVAIGMVLPDWALAIAIERLSRRHLQTAVATARLVGGRGAVDAGFLDEVVEPDAVVDTAMAEAAALADQLDGAAYAGVVAEVRRDVLARMDSTLA